MTLCYAMWGNDYSAGGSLALVHLGELGLTQQEHDLDNVWVRPMQLEWDF